MDEAHCDGCPKCVFQVCFTPSGGPQTGGGDGGYDPGDNPQDPNNNPPTQDGGSGGQTNPNLPWYLQNPDIDIFAYSPMVQSVFQSLTDFGFVMSAGQAYFLQQNSILAQRFRNYLVQNSLEKSKFVIWGINYLMDNPNTTWEEFNTWFIKTPTQQDIINELKDYPCAQSIVQQLPTLSNDIASLMKNIFQNNENYHIIFKAKSGLGDTDGVTFATSSNTGSFKAVINLNDQVLTKSTKEYILVTMYHEVIHAYLDYEKFRLGDVAFHNEYPSVVVGYNYDANGNKINRYTFLPQHNQLGAFLSQLENILSTYNPNLPAETVKAMAKAGITTMTVQENQLNLNERDTTLNKYKGTKCP